MITCRAMIAQPRIGGGGVCEDGGGHSGAAWGIDWGRILVKRKTPPPDGGGVFYFAQPRVSNIRREVTRQ